MFDIQKYETMTKIKLSEEECRWVSDCADLLINSFRPLTEKETEGIEPLVTVLDGIGQNVLREDVCVKAFTRDEIFINAPSVYDAYFQAPKTV